MTSRKNRPITRRDFLKLSGLGLTVAGLSPLIQSCGGAPATTAAPAATAAVTEAPMPTGQTLKMWWWGENEAPGLEKWLTECVAKFKTEIRQHHRADHAGYDRGDLGIPDAAAAKNAPDLQFLWNGIYHMESVWLGYLDP